MNVYEVLAHAHPALVHAPVGAVLFLPLFLGLAQRQGPSAAGWARTARLLAFLGLLGGLAAMGSGLLLARDLGGIGPDAWLAQTLRPEPAFKALLRHHQFLALAGFPAGLACLGLLWRPRGLRMALGLSLLWLALWGAAGHWGGRMVFRDPPAETPLH